MNKPITYLIASFSILFVQCSQNGTRGEAHNYREGAIATEEYYLEEDVSDYEVSPIIIEQNSEETRETQENNFQVAINNPLSTFSIDVDNASYTNIRRMLLNNQIPQPNAVRIEEMINYFDYDYPAPKNKEPFSISSEVAFCPWNPDNKLVNIGLKGMEVPMELLPANNLVFLLDVSGSMSQENKLPLLKEAFKLMVEQLRPEDYVSIVTYAGNTGVVLEPTSCKHKNYIFNALDRLNSGGGTAGQAGIELAYDLAEENFDIRANNRIILATDGDFNVGISSREALISLIETKREKGIDLTLLGFGMGNYKDATMESIANNGNGNYFYIDSRKEAQHCLVDNLAGTLMTIAKDVKIQVEFNPARVKEYRLIGYETRALENRDFKNDAKDAGELGVGHTVTAIYEVVPSIGIGSDDELKYQTTTVSNMGLESTELLTVSLRYKHPKSNEVSTMTAVVEDQPKHFIASSDNMKTAGIVAGFGLLLKESKHANNLSYLELQYLLKSLEETDESIVELNTLIERAAAMKVLTSAN